MYSCRTSSSVKTSRSENNAFNSYAIQFFYLRFSAVSLHIYTIEDSVQKMNHVSFLEADFRV